MTPAKILIVDNDEVASYIINITLKRNGYTGEITYAKDVQEGLKAIEKVAFDLVFLEIYTPDFTGFMFLETLNQKKQSRGMPIPKIVILTFSAYRKDRVLAVEYPSVKAFLMKPFTDDYIETIQAITALIP